MVLWLLLCLPHTMMMKYTHCLKRGILTGDGMIPLPSFTPSLPVILFSLPFPYIWADTDVLFGRPG